MPSRPPRILPSLLFCLLVLSPCLLHAGPPASPSTTLTATKAPFDIPKEVATWYEHLITEDSAVRSAHRRIINFGREPGTQSDIAEDPTILEWAVSSFQRIPTGEGTPFITETLDATYLAIQPIMQPMSHSYTITRRAIAKFRVQSTTIETYPANSSDDFAFSKQTLTITFQGFITLTPSPDKAARP